ncbi:O-methyltransferase [Lewinella sp. 4G2]|uniref:O-methyltransferase n=1 Tax=Lewinella sp. 4G2 TaxID=1803372 RepID=UPI0007B4E93C|nr:class I SAM-dependent methyltransferase [Lewinella sp. 4G2]OAV43356.1 hypothetical protein A3850_002080 [Lewinella sp. 4G2]
MLTARPVTPHSILAAEIESLHENMVATATEANWLAALGRCHSLAAPLEDYLERSSTAPSASLEALETATRAINWKAAFDAGQTSLELEQEMVSGKLEGQFLRLLVAISGAKRILEIGSFTGYASLAMAEALPADGQLIACEYDAFAAGFAERHLRASPAGKKVSIRVGPASDTLDELVAEGQRFDLVFIDADKQGYLNYFQTLLDHDLVPVGGLICVDNTLYQGQVYAREKVSENGEALIHFNDMVNQDQRVEQVLLPIRDGLTLIRRIS